jgi:hypothetical protein
MKEPKKARLVQLDMMGTLMIGATLAAMNDKEAEQATKGDEPKPDAPWCRDASSEPTFGIFRREGSDDGYMIAFGDAGTSLTVGRYDLGGLIRPSRGYLVTQADGVLKQVYPPFDRLPQPGQAMGLPGNVSPVFSASQLPGNNKTTITVPSK